MMPDSRFLVPRDSLSRIVTGEINWSNAEGGARRQLERSVLHIAQSKSFSLLSLAGMYKIPISQMRLLYKLVFTIRKYINSGWEILLLHGNELS